LGGKALGFSCCIRAWGFADGLPPSKTEEQKNEKEKRKERFLRMQLRKKPLSNRLQGRVHGNGEDRKYLEEWRRRGWQPIVNRYWLWSAPWRADAAVADSLVSTDEDDSATNSEE